MRLIGETRVPWPAQLGQTAPFSRPNRAALRMIKAVSHAPCPIPSRSIVLASVGVGHFS